MRQTVYIVFTVLLAFVELGSDSPKEYDDATQIDGIEGTWQIVSFGRGGQPGAINTKPGVATFQRGKWLYSQPGEFSEGGTYKTDTSRMPATLDEVQTTGPGSPSERKFIHQVKGDTLRTACKTENLLNRPSSFEEEGIYIATWKRVKK